MIDYHIHTMLCNHAEYPMEAYIQMAVDIGLKQICFLDHLTIRKSEGELSMSPDEVPFYFQAVQTLRHRYDGVIDVKAGLEIDFNSAHTNLFQDIVDTYSFDVIGSSLHFLGNLNIVSRGSAWKHGILNTDYIYGLYLEQLEKMLDYNYFDVVCHLDLVKKFGWKSSISFDKEFNEILSKIKGRNLTVELNTSGYNHPVKEAYPSFNIIKKCHEAGIGITLGSDAHNPESVGRHFDRALSLLVSAGYKHLTTFKRRKPGKISLRNAC